MRVRFIGRLPRRGFSGGRLHALMMAEALGRMGATVDFITDRDSEMWKAVEPSGQVALRVSREFWRLPLQVDRSIDIVVLVPNLGRPRLHRRWVRHAKECGALLVILSFETPNWFNEVSPYPRDPDLWKGWELASREADLILSLSRTGDGYAREFFDGVPRHCQFDYCYPSVNSVVADRVPYSGKRLNQIVMLTRVDAHKGIGALEALCHRDFSGYHLILCVGGGTFSNETQGRWQERFAEVGVMLEVRQGVSEREKYRLLKESRILFFPSRFEGFGLPPLEAAYCGCPSACSDLPVLREYSNSLFEFGDPGSVESMRDAARRALTRSPTFEERARPLKDAARLEALGSRLMLLFNRLREAQR